MTLPLTSRSLRRKSYFVGSILYLFVAVVKNASVTAWSSPSSYGYARRVRQHKVLNRLPHSTTRSLQQTYIIEQRKKVVYRETALSAADMVPPSSGTQVKLPKQLVKKKLQTFTRHLEVECWKRSDLRGLEPILQAVASACKQITRIVQRAQTDDVYGVAVDPITGNPLSDTNVQGEVQQKLDVLCNTIMLQAFCGSGREIHAVASEEEDRPRCCSEVMVRYSCRSTECFLEIMTHKRFIVVSLSS